MSSGNESFTTQNPTNSSKAKKLITRKYIRDAGGFATLEDQEVPHGTEPDAVAYKTLESEIVNNQNTGKSRRHVTTIGTPVAAVDKDVPEPDLGKFVVRETNTDLIVPAGTAADSSFLGLGSVVKEMNSENFLKSSKAAVDAFGNIVETSTDSEGHLEAVTTTVVAKGTSVPADTAGVSYQQVDVSQTKALLTTRALSNTGASAWSTWSKTYLITERFNFPSYYTDSGLASGSGPTAGYKLVPIVSSLAIGQGRSLVAPFWDIRWGFTVPCQVKVVETLVSEATMATFIGVPPAAAAAPQTVPFQDLTKDVHYDGILFRVHLQNLLIDAVAVDYTLGGSDSYYGGSFTRETLTIPASTLSATAYLAMKTAGTYQLISDTFTPWKSGLFKRTRKYVVML